MIIMVTIIIRKNNYFIRFKTLNSKPIILFDNRMNITLIHVKIDSDFLLD